MPDEISQSFVSVDASGNITFDFTGHIKAAGVDLDELTTLSPAAAVNWKRTSDGLVAAFIEATRTGVLHELGLQSVDPDVPSTHADLTASITSGGGGSRARAKAFGPGGNWTRTLVDDTGKSDFVVATGFGTNKAPDSDLLDGIDSLGFLKLLTVANRRISFGTGIVTWPGGTQGSNGSTIAHGLGTIPLAYAWVIEGIGNPDFLYGFQGADANNIYPAGWNPLGVQGAGNKTIYWLAIA